MLQRKKKEQRQFLSYSHISLLSNPVPKWFISIEPLLYNVAGNYQKLDLQCAISSLLCSPNVAPSNDLSPYCVSVCVRVCGKANWFHHFPIARCRFFPLFITASCIYNCIAARVDTPVNQGIGWAKSAKSGSPVCDKWNGSRD